MIDKNNIKAAEEIHSDKGYELGNKEDYDAFVKKRQEAALDEMVRINQEMGLYDDFESIHKYNKETQEVKIQQINK